MSIIVDALQKLQDTSIYDSAFEPRETHGHKKLQKSSRNYGLVIIALKIAAVLLIIFAIVFNYFLFTNTDEIEYKFEDNKYTRIESTENNLPQLKTLEDAPKNPEFENFEDKKSMQVANEASPIEANVNNPIIEKSEITIDSEDFIVDSVENPQTDIFQMEKEEAAELPMVKNEVQPQLVETPITPVINPDPKPQWILQGVEQFKTGSLDKALSNWRKGFDKLENNTQLFSIMINYNPDLARQIINSLFEKDYPVFTVIAKFRGKKAYYTMILPDQNALETSKEAVISQFSIEPFIISKANMEKRIIALEKINLRKEKPVKQINIEKLITDAEQAVYQGNYKRAQKILSPHLKKNANNWKLLFWLGSAELGQRNLIRADRLFLQAQSINPDVAQVWTQRALIAQEHNDHASALAFLNKAKALAPKTPEIILNIAYSQEALGNENGAAYSYREFLSLTRGISGYEDLIQSAEIRLNDLVYKK